VNLAPARRIGVDVPHHMIARADASTGKVPAAELASAARDGGIRRYAPAIRVSQTPGQDDLFGTL
jgi:hypothetical protein